MDQRSAEGSGNVRQLSDWIDRRVEGRWRLAEAILYVATVVGAWLTRFVQDDAFITYRYARNLARGNGLVFNVGERVEGYTNFLWTLIHVVPEKLGWSSPLFGELLGIACLLGTVAVTLRLAKRVFASEAAGFLAAVVLVANVTFLSYGTGGLETMLQTFLVLSATALLLPYVLRTSSASETAPTWQVRRLVAGVAAGMAVLTRLDSSVLVATVVIVHLVGVWRGESEDRRFRFLLFAAAQISAPAAVLIVPWIAWKVSYYHELLPNTFFAKSAGSPLIPILYGIFYLVGFFVSYGAFLLVPRFGRYRRSFFQIPGMSQLMWVVPIWFLYICAVGADFMEYRFMVPLMPVLALLAAYLIDRFRNLKWQCLLVAVLLLMSGIHHIAPSILPYPVLTFEELSHWPGGSDTSWRGMGEELHGYFPGGEEAENQPVIAVAPLGLISYFSDLPTIDMLGLTDAYVARHGDSIEPYTPGHVRMAPVPYLIDRDVNLVVAEPMMVDFDSDRSAYRLSELVVMYPSVDLRELPSDAKVIEIPRRNGKRWVIIYLHKNEKVESAIAEHGWRVLPIDRICRDEDRELVDPSSPLAGIVNRISRNLGKRTCDLPPAN